MRASIVSQRFVGLILCLTSIKLVEPRPDWTAELGQQVYGLVYAGADQHIPLSSFNPGPFEDEHADSPAAVLVARGTPDVIAAVNVARKHKLRIAASGGRHWAIDAKNAAAGLSVDLSQMRGVVIDPVQQTAVAQGGALGGDVLHEAALWGFSLPWGDVNCTGMGLALGGGIGLAMRQHGLACDNILAAQIVIANGSLISVSSTEHPELLAGVRGAGTVFGIVTAVTFRLFKGASDVYAGHLMLADDSNFTTTRYLTDFTMEALAKYPGLGTEVLSFAELSQVMVLVNFFGGESVEEKAAVFDPLRALGVVADGLGPQHSSLNAVNDFFSAFTAGFGGVKTFCFSGLISKEQLLNGSHDALMRAHALASRVTPGLLLTDWLGGATENTTSFTPFRGAYMHFLAVMAHPSNQLLLSTAKQMEEIMAGYATLYAYDNLSTDPYPGNYLNDFTTEALAEFPGLGIELFSLPTIGQAMIQVNFFGEESMAHPGPPALREEKAAVFDPLRALGHVVDSLGANISSIVGLNDWLTAFGAGSAGAKSFSFSGIMSKEQLTAGGDEALLEAHALASEATAAGLPTDWLGGATENTTSFTPFRGAYMHFLSVFAHPDSEVLISVAEQMEEIMAGYAVLYPYGNLSSDMFPGVPVLYSHVCLEHNLVVKVGGADNLHYLQHFKGLVDPDNLFRNHQFTGLVPS